MEIVPGTAVGFTTHARERMVEMGLEPSEVASAVASPEISYPGRGDRHVRVRGRLAVVVSRSGRTVVTVLWHGLEGRHSSTAA